MSMSQEEIEALMSGAESVEIDEPEKEVAEEPKEESTDTNTKKTSEDESEDLSEADLDAESVDDIANEDIDAILAGVEGIVDDQSDSQEDATSSKTEETKAKTAEELFDSNEYPFPARNENKVVNQLNEVADDSEEKASKIFDVLSFILDENNDIQNYNKSMGKFIESQVILLEALSQKFPNIDVFNENLAMAKSLTETSKELSSKVDGENNKVFEAMELMQYHDINRQKIERVMAVIRKLNSYLNGIFEDDSDKAEVQIAKHISGDSNEVVGAEDIDALISEFSN